MSEPIKPPDPDAGKVIGGRFILPSGNGMQASCKHRKAGACGGCYARLVQALYAIEDDPIDAAAIVKRTWAAMKGDA